jgi:hypothetical protein
LLVDDADGLHGRETLLDDAIACADRCLMVFDEIGDRFWTARAMHHKSEVLKAQGQHQASLARRQQAQEVARGMAYLSFTDQVTPPSGDGPQPGPPPSGAQ